MIGFSAVWLVYVDCLDLIHWTEEWSTHTQDSCYNTSSCKYSRHVTPLTSDNERYYDIRLKLTAIAGLVQPAAHLELATGFPHPQYILRWYWKVVQSWTAMDAGNLRPQCLEQAKGKSHKTLPHGLQLQSLRWKSTGLKSWDLNYSICIFKLLTIQFALKLGEALASILSHLCTYFVKGVLLCSITFQFQSNLFHVSCVCSWYQAK